MKYEPTYQTKSPTKFVKNERAAEATRPTALQLETEDRLSLFAHIVIFGTVAAMLIGEQILTALGWY